MVVSEVFAEPVPAAQCAVESPQVDGDGGTCELGVDLVRGGMIEVGEDGEGVQPGIACGSVAAGDMVTVAEVGEYFGLRA